MHNNQVRAGSLLGDMFSMSLYKWNQGRLTRQVTFAALAVVMGLGAWRLSQVIAGFAGGDAGGADSGLLRFLLPADAGEKYRFLLWISHPAVLRFLIPAVLLAVAVWLAFRIVNIPRFAEFLIAVEAEMAKVSWPTNHEVFRSSAVVIFLIFALAFLLAAFDLFWGFLLHPAELWALVRSGWQS